MSQFEYQPLNPALHTGTDLANRLNQWIPAQMSSHSGSARPSYAIAGMIWVDTSTAGIHEVKYFDGSDDVLLYVIDINNSTISFGGGGGSGQNYQGVIDATTTVAPLAPSVGDYYINNTNGTVHTSFGLPVANEPVMSGDTLVFDGTEWGLIPSQVDLSGYLPLAGGVLTGPLELAGPPTLPNHPVTLDYFNQNSSANSLPLSGGTMTGPLVLNGDPANPLEAATKQYTDAGLALKANKAGDTFTGPITLSGNPVNNLHAATKGYVDNWHDPQKLNISGGTLTGLLTLSGNAINPLHAVPKQQLDTALTSVVVSTGAPDGGKLVRTTIAGKIDASLISLSGTPNFKGFIDPTTTAPSHNAGDYYILDITGNFHGSWGPPIAGTSGDAGDVVASDGFTWHYSNGIGTGSYIFTNGQQVLGDQFELIASNTTAKTIIDGGDRTLSSIKNVTLQGGQFGTPDNLFSLIYSDSAGTSPSASELIKGGIGINRADFQLWGLDAADLPTKLLSIPYFSTLSNYAQDDFVRRDGLIWQAKEAVTAGAFDISQWEVAAPSGVPLMNHSLQYDANVVAVNPDDGILYKANQQTTGDGTFYPAEWDAIVTDHGQMTGLGDDDHAQYHNDARGDIRYYTKTQIDSQMAAIDHNNLSNLTVGDPHTQYLNNTRGDIRYYTKSQIDGLLTGIDHNTLSNLTIGDPHTQYLNNARGDARYYTQSQVNSLVTGIDHNTLSNLTIGDPHTQYLNNARGDARYYTQSQVNSLIAGAGLPNEIVNGTSSVVIPSVNGDIQINHNGTLFAEFTDAYPDSVAFFHGGVNVNGSLSVAGTIFGDLGNFVSGLISQGFDVLTTDTGYTQSQVDALIAGTGSPNSIVNGTSSVDIPIVDGDIIARVNGVEKFRSTAEASIITNYSQPTLHNMLPGGIIINKSVGATGNVFFAITDANSTTIDGVDTTTFLKILKSPSGILLNFSGAVGKTGSMGVSAGADTPVQIADLSSLSISAPISLGATSYSSGTFGSFEDDQYCLIFKSYSKNITAFDGQGRIQLASGLITGGKVPITGADVGSIQINTGTLNGISQYWLNDSLNQPFTSLAPAKAYGTTSKLDPSLGGFNLSGFSQSITGINLSGLAGTSQTGFNSGAIHLNAALSDGIGGSTAIPTTDNVFTVANNGATLLRMTGNGFLCTYRGFQGYQSGYDSSDIGSEQFLSIRSNPNGAIIQGNGTTTSAKALNLNGYSGSQSNALFSGNATVSIGCSLLSGGLQPLNSDSVVFTISNFTTHLLNLTGGGELHTLSHLVSRSGIAINNATRHAGALSGKELSADPANPVEGEYVLWMSDGTGTGNDGDILIKRTANSVTDIITLGAGGGGLANVVEDTTPQLGGSLDAQSNSITALDDLYFTGKIISGNDASPDVIDNGLNLFGGSTGVLFALKRTGFTNPFSTTGGVNTYGDFRSSPTGGLVLKGYGSTNSGLQIQGYRQTPTTGSGWGCINITAYKGTGLGQNLDATENILAILNATTVLVMVKGNGDIETIGSIKATGQVTSKTTQSATTTTTRSSVAADECSMVDIANAGAITYTITNANHAVGATINIMQSGAGQITIALNTGTLNKASAFTTKTSEQWAVVTAWKRASTEWVLFGGLEAA